MKRFLLGAVALLSFLPRAHADTHYLSPGTDGWFHQQSPYMISVRAGTLGIGPEIAYHPVGSHFGFRLDYDTYSFNIHDIYHDDAHLSTRYSGQSITGILRTRYDARARLSNGTIFADYYPWSRSGFRLTAGLNINGNKLNVDGTGTAANLSVNGDSRSLLSQSILKAANIKYGDTNSISGRVHYNRVAPYVGLGFNTRLGGGFTLNGDLGALFQGSATTTIEPNGVLAQIATSTQAFERDRSEIQHYANKAHVYPVAMIGIGYRF